MKVVFGSIIFAATAMVVGSAPALGVGQIPGVLVEQRQPDYYRDVRSQYPQYVSPCAAAAAAAASSPIAAITSPASYQMNIAPYHGYPQVSQQYGYGMPHYRSVELEPEQEIMSFSDSEHMMSEHVPMARYAYAAPAASHAAYVPITSPTSGPVYGVFPNANAGGCNVPLLFSCTPSVVQGHVAQTMPQYTAVGNSYRGVDSLAHHDTHAAHEEPSVQEHSIPAHESSHAMVHQ